MGLVDWSLLYARGDRDRGRVSIQLKFCWVSLFTVSSICCATYLSLSLSLSPLLPFMIELHKSFVPRMIIQQQHTIRTGKPVLPVSSSNHYLVFSVPEDDGNEEDKFSIDCKSRLDALERFYDERRGKRQKRVQVARETSQNVYQSSSDVLRTYPFQPKIALFDLWEPEAVCIVEERSGGDERFDAFSDGPKFVCGVDYLRELYSTTDKQQTDTQQQQQQQQRRRQPTEPCLVYSVGSNNDVAFEKAIKRDIGCEIHTFDPTLTKPFVGDAYSTFHPWGLGEEGASDRRGFKEYSFDHIARELGHTNRTINILKIDCDGCEYTTMPPVFEAVAKGKFKIDQILIEMHRPGVQDIFEPPTKFFELADKAGYRITHKERNHWGCAGAHCVEYALVSNDFLRSMTASVIC